MNIKNHTQALGSIAILALTTYGFAQGPALKMNSPTKLQINGRVGNYYQLETSTNLGSNWSPHGTEFSPSGLMYTQTIAGVNDKQRYFRAKVLTSATNNSFQTFCAEEDNVNVPLWGDVKQYFITATHPLYTLTNWTCTANFSNCTNTGGATDYTFTPQWAKPLDNGVDVMQVWRKDKWWRPSGMNVTLNGGSLYTNMHYIVLSRKIPDQGSWPEFFVLYSDGNMRLIPFPPNTSVSSVCYGSSIVVGPAIPSDRPFAEISSIDYRSASRTMLVTYKNGGSAILDVNTVTRTNAIVKVTVNYPSDKPFCTFRSMFVYDGNSDADHVDWIDFLGTTHNTPIMSFSTMTGTNWFFKRQTPSMHNHSGPDIRIVVN